MRANRPDNSGPRPGLLLVLIGVSIVLITVWFREGATGPLHRVRSSVHAASAPVSAVGEFMTRPVRVSIAWLGDLGVSRSQLEQLRQQNERLRTTVAELEEARLENERLRKLVDLTRTKDIRKVAARVIGRPTNQWENDFTIDRGTDDGVTDGMPVVGPFGLLGQTVDVRGSSARVRLINDQRSGVAALVQRNRAEGVVRGSVDGRLSLEFVSIDTTIKAGDVVVTSGIGGVYPKGLVIGEVSQVDRAGNTLYQDVTVEPAGKVGRLEEVLIYIEAPTTPAPEGGE